MLNLTDKQSLINAKLQVLNTIDSDISDIDLNRTLLELKLNLLDVHNKSDMEQREYNSSLLKFIEAFDLPTNY